MNIRCKLGFHKWNYKNKRCGDPILDLMFWTSTRYCERCERIEEALIIIGSFLPPLYEKKTLTHNGRE
jgi:hypothetical protein